MNIERIFDFLDRSAEKNLDAPALAHRRKGEWTTVSYREWKHQADIVSKTLLGLGVGKGDLIGSVSLNRPEWNFLDIGVQQIGAVHVALNPAYSVQDLMFIINQTEVSYLFCGNKFLYKILLPHVSDLHFLKGFYCMEEGEGIEWWGDMLATAVSAEDKTEIQKHKDAVSANDLTTIIYTSGTGGNPKGAMHTHTTLGRMARFLTDHYKLEYGDKVLSLLSMSHSFERLHYCFYMRQGVAIYYAETTTPIQEQIKEVKPQMILCVPLILEGLYKGILQKDSSDEAKAALAFTKEFDYKNREQFYNSDEYKKHEPVYERWRNELGGAFKQIITGAAIIPEYLVKFYWTIKIPLFECYGSTEVLLHTISHESFQYKPDCVGQPPAYAQMKIVESGEIWMKTESCMKGYYKLEEHSAEVLTADGWYRSGDLGYVDDEGFLYLDGRANAVMKLANGKYINPENVEQKLLSSPLIKNMFITLDERTHLIAVVRPVSASVTEDEQQQIIDHINQNYNRSVVPSDQIGRMLLVYDTWAVDTGEYTPTMKLKRKVLLKKYAPLFDNAIVVG